MSRSYFVEPEVTRLVLLDVMLAQHVKLDQELAALVSGKGPEKDIQAKRDALKVAAERLARAEDDPGRFIDVKRRLNAGEQRKVFTKMMRDMTPGEKVQIDPDQVGMTKLVAYLVGWSFTAKDDSPVPVSESAIDNLHPDLYGDLIQAIDQHEAAQDATRKNVQHGATT